MKEAIQMRYGIDNTFKSSTNPQPARRAAVASVPTTTLACRTKTPFARALALLIAVGMSIGNAFGATISVDADITTSTTWTADNTYVLNGVIFVTNGATLTINAGTVIRGQPDSATTGTNNPGTLVIARGCRILANGTFTQPIIFTDMNDDNVPGGAKANSLYNNNPNNNISEQWGGVVVLGKTYIAAGTGDGPSTTAERQAEGLTRADALFGGGDDDDDSGSLTYVSIRYGGFGLAANSEVNGLTMGAVGRGTTLHHVEVANNVDDGFEWFGGTVNSKYLLTWNIGDDAFDTDMGYRGKSQFGLSVKGACKPSAPTESGVGDKAFEMDGGEAPVNSRPYSLSQWRNYTVIGMGPGAGDKGLVIRDNARPQFYHSIIMDMGDDAVTIEDLATGADSAEGWTTAANGGFPDAASFYVAQTQGTGRFQTEIADSVFFGIGDQIDVRSGDSGSSAPLGVMTGKSNVTATTSPVRTVTRQAAASNTGKTVVSSLDPRPTAAAQGVTIALPGEGFFDVVNYRGAFGPAENWAAGWTLISSMGVLDTTAAVGNQVVVNADITASTTWTATNTYILDGVIFVTNGATLTINAGTVVRGRSDGETPGSNNPGTLVISRGCRLLANGTFTQPIIFTDMDDDNVPGGAKANPLYNNNVNSNVSERWGGVVILGRTYIAYNTAGGPSTTAERQAEGLTRADALFGGGDDDDSSGSLTYVSIRYGGFGLAANEEVNGLTMGAVGRGTTLHHVEVANNVDDGFEWFGGTVNSKYLLTWNIGDDAFDTDMGYRGKSQFGLSVKGTCKPNGPVGGGVADSGFEMDGGEAPVDSRPYSLSQWRNFTLIGMGAGDKGLVIRDNSRPQFYHSIVMDMGDDAVTIQDLASGVDSADGWTTAANGGFPDAASFYVAQTQGTGRFQTEIADSVFFGIGDQIDVRSGSTTAAIGVMTGKSNVAATTSPVREVTHQAAASNTGKTVVSSLDPRPTAAAQGVTIALPGEGFFDVVNYRGAFGPAENWAAGWTLISSMGVLDTTTAVGNQVVVNADITTSTTWTATNTYILDGVIFVTNGATLTINAGTVVRGRSDGETAGSNNPGTLVISRGCRILANGTFTQPVIFTDMDDDNVPGGAKANPLYNNNVNSNVSERWGGIVVLGRTYIAYNTAGGLSATAERQAEGLTRADALFGGGDDDDNSGSLTYVSIRYGGFGLAANEEVNGLTMGAVGRGTTLHHVEVANNVDDGFEWFGGTVNSKYLLTWNIGDDAFDTDMGYRGRSQFGLSVKGTCKPNGPVGGGVADSGFEMDGGEAPVDSRPYSLSQWRNFTLIGMSAGDKGLVIRDNARPQFYHSIVMDMGDDAVTIQDLASGVDSAEGWTTAANGGFPDAASFYVAQSQGTGRFQTEIADSVFFGIGDQIDVRSGSTTAAIGVMTGKSNVAATASPLREVTRQAAASNTGKTVVSSLDPRPTAAAQGVTIALPGEGFFDVVNYRGAFGPAENWAAGWTLISSMGVLNTTAAVGNQVVVNADITASTTWTATNTYILDGVIFVTNGATLTINAGTVVRGRSDGETAGSNNPGTLVIARGSKLFANGTFTQPVVFTDMDDDNVPGGAKANPLYNNNVNSNVSERWGGVVVLGRTYIAYNTAGGPSTTAERQAEGLTRADALFGGGDDDDNSGSLTYVSIRYGGFGLAANEEVNGLTMGAVGRGTTLHHVEVANNVDDGFEWFGGTVNSKYLLTWNIGDDAFDTDMGYRGKSQFGLSVKGTCKPNGPVGGGVADSAFEMDGGEAPVDSRPYSLSQWRNFTLIGMGAGDKGLVIRDNSRPQFYHSIIMDMGDDAVTIQDLASGVDSAEGWTTAANGGFPDAASFYVAQTQGTGRFQTEIADSVFFGIGDQIDVRSGSTTAAIGVMTGKSNVAATTSPLREVTHQAAASNTGKTVVSSLDPRPTAMAQGVTISLAGEGFFDVVNYRGAFGPAENWAAGWTLISSMGVLDTTTAVPVTQTAVLAPAKFNWMSFYAQPTSLAVADVFAGALNQILIIKDDDGKFYIPAGATAFNPDTPFGSLAQIVLSEGYQVFLRQTVVDPVNQAVTGIPVVPGNLTIQVAAAKFNLVPYPFACEASVAAVLSPEMLQKILIIRDDDGKFYIPAGATVFNPDTPFGSLSMFRPSEGYQVFARSAGFTLVYNDIVCP